MKSERLRPYPILLFLRVFWELFRYDLVLPVAGLPAIYRGLNREVTAPSGRDGSPAVSRNGSAAAICRAIDTAASFYWKRVLCLQRSVVTARVLQSYSFSAEVVIGFGFAPFVSHAWVEIDGRIVNDSTGYAAKLQVLDRIGPAAANV